MQSQKTTNGIDAAADRDAWCKAAAARKYDFGEDGLPEMFAEGVGLMSLAPLPGFSLLPEAVHNAVFHSVAQFAGNRVGQNAEGNVNAVIAAFVTEGKMPDAKSNNAKDAAYRSGIRARVDGALGKLASNASDGAKKERAEAVEKAMEANRAKLYDSIVAAARESAKNVPVSASTAKPKKAKDLSDAMQFDA